jgi:hypothetical protein
MRLLVFGLELNLRRHRLPRGGPGVVQGRPHAARPRGPPPQLQQAGPLLRAPARAVPIPGAEPLQVRGNAACPLTLHELPPEVYEHERDMLMLDAPKG